MDGDDSVYDDVEASTLASKDGCGNGGAKSSTGHPKTVGQVKTALKKLKIRGKGNKRKEGKTAEPPKGGTGRPASASSTDSSGTDFEEYAQCDTRNGEDDQEDLYDDWEVSNPQPSDESKGNALTTKLKNIFNKKGKQKAKKSSGNSDTDSDDYEVPEVFDNTQAVGEGLPPHPPALPPRPLKAAVQATGSAPISSPPLSSPGDKTEPADRKLNSTSESNAPSSKNGNPSPDCHGQPKSKKPWFRRNKNNVKGQQPAATPPSNNSGNRTQEIDNIYVDLEDEPSQTKPVNPAMPAKPAKTTGVSQFTKEPLYQWYSKDKMLRNSLPADTEKSTSDEESIYESVERFLETSNGPGQSSPPTSGQIDFEGKHKRRMIIEDVFKSNGNLHRALWSQMPEVIKLGILKTLPDKDRKIQEAMFEVMTSEASFQRSLKILQEVFLQAPELNPDLGADCCVITRQDHLALFSNIAHIKDISEGLLRDLEGRWRESCYLRDVCDIVDEHASKNLEPFVRYCSNQIFQEKTLKSLKQTNAGFNEAITRLEQHPECQCLPLASFLALPMQRITRLPLLVDAILHRLDQYSVRHATTTRALVTLHKVATRCDQAARKMQESEQMCLLATSLEFRVKEIGVASASRFLVKQGSLNVVKFDETSLKTINKKLLSNKTRVHILLFNDLLILTKKKGSTYSVRDYCPRNSLHVEAVDEPDKSRHLLPGMAAGQENILFLALLANHEGKQVEMVLSCESESDRTRWIDAMNPKTSSSESEETVYDLWDCPQHQCVRKYLARQTDELNLEESDVINVTRKMADGWCEGERVRDGAKGWFPTHHTEEILNSHVRARNLKLRYRLMIASAQEYKKNTTAQKDTTGRS